MIYNLRMTTYDAAFTAITDDQWMGLRALIPTLAAERDKQGSWDEFCTDADGMQAIAELKLTVSFAENRSSEGLMWVRLQDRIKQLELRQEDTAGQMLNGAGVHIHVPDLCLMHVREVTHLDDCCTDELQVHLNEGWCILAVCPPNAKRRPDYILGRSRQSS